MAATGQPRLADPRADVPDRGGPSLRRILVPVNLAGEWDETLGVAAGVCAGVGGLLRLVHVRIFEPPLRGCARFYPQTAAEAAAVLDEALLTVWGYGVPATTAVVEAARPEVAAAIAQQAAGWRADVIVLTRRPRLAISRLLLGSVPDQVMRKASCPVLAVHPRPSHGRFRSHASR